MLPWWIVLSLLRTQSNDAPVDTWDYTDTEAWGHRYPLCSGPLQSPIALRKDEASTAAPPRVVATAAAVEWEVEVRNTGRTIVMNMTYDPRSRETPRQAPIQLVSQQEPLFGTFDLGEVHFHFGNVSGNPGSVHAIGDRFFDAEVHFVFFDNSFESNDLAARVPGGCVVIAIPLNREGRYQRRQLPFPTLGLERRIEAVSARGDYFTYDVNLTNMREMLSVALRRVYMYSGSLTTPPCNPVVIWFVTAIETSVNAVFLDRLITGVYRDRDRRVLMGNNWRPLREKGNRTVYTVQSN
ncbi:Carbonic anhydrase 9 [Amphibalanus amphitrite]|uniref:carbonic anhydrase n=1 Tax=Amphibalanus amphitrite TaxID=1232801 RepID=A0A6A4WJ34_AMPAM|nr:carbonic anhydrase 9-like [Amphibalanus amphitrite]KAF0303650.1 Carbonic anhydrase 9 [Amphibalanus amphitrite]